MLTYAAQNGNKRIAKICLRRGCKINAQNFRGQTALHYCYSFGYSELGEYLESKVLLRRY
jgi:ankyrin repeat protein